MAKISVIKVSQLDIPTRIDAEYYQAEYLAVDKKIMSGDWKFLNDFCGKVTDGTHFTPTYTNSGIIFLSALNVLENRMYFSKFNFISEKEHEILKKRAFPKSGDILLRKVGVGPRYASVIPEIDFEFSIFVSLALIKLKKEFQIINYYISTFINSYYGQKQLLRFNKGISQPDLHLEDIKRLKIPLPTKEIIRGVNEYVKLAQKNLIESQKMINEAENLLLKELDYDVPNECELAYIRKSKEIQVNSRIDAEYYKPYYDRIIEQIQEYGSENAEKIISVLNKNYIPKKKVKYKYIELANISKDAGFINDCMIEFGENLPSRARRLVRSGDVIISSIEGSLKSCAIITEEYDNALCSTGFYVIKSKSINPETLFILFKSKPIQELLKKGCSGTILTALNQNELEKIPIPLIEKKIQKIIKEKIQKSYFLRKKHKKQIQIAKKIIENYISDGGYKTEKNK